MRSIELQKAAKRLRQQSGVRRKTYNLHWVDDQLDQLMVELSQQAKQSPELTAAIECLKAAKRLLAAYSQRTIDTPYMSISKTRSSRF